MFLFLSLSSCADDFPVLNQVCNENQVIDPFTYKCMDFVDKVCTPGEILFFDSCLKTEEINKMYDEIVFNNTNILLTRVHTKKEEYELQNALASDFFIDRVKYNGAILNITKGNKKAAESLVSLCTLSHFSQNSVPCHILSEVYDQKELGMMNYKNWPIKGPFMSYKSSTEEEIFAESILKSEFVSQRKISIVLAQWTIDGDFLGYKVLSDELIKCSVKNENTHLWRKFGGNFYSECQINLYDEMNKTSTILYEPFIVDNYNKSDDSYVIRPLPVYDMSYADQNGILVNEENNPEKHVYTRRFFLMDNISTDGYVQFLQNFTLFFRTKKDDPSHIFTPVVIVNYMQTFNSNIKEIEPSFKPLNDFLETSEYSFNVVLTENTTVFWEIVVITFTVMLLFILIFVVLKNIVYFKRHIGYKMSPMLIFGICNCVFDFFGFGLSLYVFAYCIYLFGAFKLQSSVFVTFPSDEEFAIVYPMMWSLFTLKLIALIFQILMNSEQNMFIVDWNENNENDSVSVWRRIMIANQFCSISTCRAYSIPLSIITYLFIQTGFDYDLISQPIPSFSLIDMGKSSMVLKIGWTVFVFICIGLVQYLWVILIYWPIGNDPFKNFINICSTTNISLVINESKSFGYYIHGRSDYHSPSSQVADNKSGVYMIFYEKEFGQRFNQIFLTSMAQTGSSPLKETAASIPTATINSYKDINKLLTQFFDPSNEESYPLDVQESNGKSFSFAGIAPQTDTSSIMIPINDTKYKKTMLYGIQWSLYAFYIIMFCCFEFVTNSNAISGFIVYIFDLIVVHIFKALAKLNISRKSLLDIRFIE